MREMLKVYGCFMFATCLGVLLLDGLDTYGYLYGILVGSTGAILFHKQ